jgi:hypothetical protein
MPVPPEYKHNKPKRRRHLILSTGGWVGLLMAIAIGGAISEALAFPAGVLWISLCLFDPKRGGW